MEPRVEKKPAILRGAYRTKVAPEIVDVFIESSGDLHQIAHAFIDEEGK